MEAISVAEMEQRVNAKLEPFDWLVCCINQQVVGYAYYGAFHARKAYSHTVETSIYLAQEAMGKGLGKALYEALIASATAKGFRELIGIIALPNASSVALHHRFGFEQVGFLKRVGYKFDRYIDVGIWQKSIASFEADAT